MFSLHTTATYSTIYVRFIIQEEGKMLLSGLFCAWVCIREVLAGRKRGPSNAKGDSPSNIRRTVEQLAQTGQFINMVDYLENVEREHGNALC